MDDKKGNIILGIILAILMIIAIAIVIINPNKVETVNYAKEQGNTNSEEVTANTNKTNNEELEKEERQKSMQEGKKFCNNWDAGLLASVNPIHKNVDFSESTLKIKHYFDTNAKNPKSIPMLEYLLLNYWVKCYENIDGNIFEVFSDMDDLIQQCAAKENSKDGIYKITSNLQSAYQNFKKPQDEFFDEIPPDCD